MNKNVKLLSLIAIIFCGLDWVYVEVNAYQLNLISFLMMVILVPAILYAASIAGFLQGVIMKNGKKRMLIYGGFSVVYTVVVYVLLNVMNISFDKIIDNSNALGQGSENVSISNIEYNNGMSSYVLIFLLVLVFVVGFSMLFNKKKEDKSYAHK